MKQLPRRVLGISFALTAVLTLAMEAEIESKVLAMATKRFGAASGERLQPWFSLMRNSVNLTEADKLVQVNTFFNRIPNESDAAHWGSVDFWASPVELLASNGGDCEDFALAKYVTLRELGVPEERLRLTYAKVFLRESGQIQSHMVLTYYPTPNAEPLVLDNLTNAIKPASSRKDLTPAHSFNVGVLWTARERQGGQRTSESNDHLPWRDLRMRMLHLDESK